MARMNNDRCAVHVTINAIVGNARTAKNVKRVRKHFVEKDDAEPMQSVLDRAEKMGLKVAWVNESSPGKFHYYWNVAADVEDDVEGFRQRQRLLVAAFNGGRESIDPPRVLRLPGFWHQKGKPFQVRKVYHDASAPEYDRFDFECALSSITLADSERPDAAGTSEADEDQAAIESAITHFKTFPRAVSDTDTPDGKKNKKGNSTTFDAIAKARDFGVGLETCFELALEHYNPRCEPPWEYEALRTIAENVYRYATGAQGKDHPHVEAQRHFEGADPYTAEEMDAYREACRALDEKNAPARETAKAKMFAEKGSKRCKDFLAYLPELPNAFIYIPQGGDAMWNAMGVSMTCRGPALIDPRKADMSEDELSLEEFPDRFLRNKAGEIIYQSGADAVLSEPTQRVSGQTWWPGKPAVLLDTVVRVKGGVLQEKGMHSFNRYHPPLDPRRYFQTHAAIDPKPWLDHVKLIYPDDWQHIVNCLAYRVQHPEEKILHALVLGGPTRIGKDTILEPIPFAVGPWNFATTGAAAIMDTPQFNPYLEAVVCLVNEAKDFGDDNRVGFYHRMKEWLGGTAGGVLPVADKNVKVHPVIDVWFAIITTNFKVHGLFLPDDDARHYVAWSNRTWADWGYASMEENDEKYFKPLYEWFANGGNEAVAYYLATLDVSGFRPKAPPRKTDAWYEIVNAYADPNNAPLATILENLGDPPAVTVNEILAADADGELNWMDPKYRTAVPGQMEAAGYVHQRNPGGKGRWQVGTKRREIAIYVQAKLGKAERVKAAQEAFGRARDRALQAEKGKPGSMPEADAG